ncbi:uncharacterized protein EI97DRAFT_412879 [Westerdykella ornata]|uniref:Homeobox domain-containing protein n=1 Tax=Westerdykella ornata TaxID=318751 RepID=A0A6A6JV83_WESOR|nr:uncharacterized protein EI97DRAFT_412879 [Westerdykella ornata]KAF2279656.1 hypothetical protein EI97DRAFT_412879 [Westerdykella ornata]
MLELQRSYYHYYQAPLQTSRKRGNLPKDATEMLKKWLEENKDTPYPTEDQKKIFERETGLTLQQISNWFINARRRHLGRSGILGKNNGNSAGNPATASGNY